MQARSVFAVGGDSRRRLPQNSRKSATGVASHKSYVGELIALGTNVLNAASCRQPRRTELPADSPGGANEVHEQRVQRSNVLQNDTRCPNERLGSILAMGVPGLFVS